VLVVDVTGSMGPGAGDGFNHDPMRNGSCERMEAVRHVLAKRAIYTQLLHRSLLIWNHQLADQSLMYSVLPRAKQIMLQLYQVQVRSWINTQELMYSVKSTLSPTVYLRSETAFVRQGL